MFDFILQLFNISSWSGDSRVKRFLVTVHLQESIGSTKAYTSTTTLFFLNEANLQIAETADKS